MNVSTSPEPGWLILVLIALVLGGLVGAYAWGHRRARGAERRPRRWGRALFTLALVCLLAGFLAPLWQSRVADFDHLVRDDSQTAHRFQPHPPFVAQPTHPTPAHPAGQGSAWSDAVERVHRPARYASLASSARAIAHQISDRLADVGTPEVLVLELPGKRPAAEMQVWGQTVRQQLRASLPTGEIRTRTYSPGELNVPGDEANSSDPTVVIRLDVFTANANGGISHSHAEQLGNLPGSLSGSLAAQIQNRGEQQEFTAAFMEKPWVVDYSKFLSEHPGQSWFAGRSRDLLVASELEARSQAVRAAAEQVASEIRLEAISALGARRAAAIPLERLSVEMERAIQDGSYVADEFAQQLETGEGRVWRHALLVRVSPEQKAEQAGHLLHYVRQQRARRIAGAGSFGGLTVLTLVMYLVLNAATKGYYRAFLIGFSSLLVLSAAATLLLVIS